MLEISPVLAGTYDAPDYVPPNNLASTQVDDASAVDSRRYTKFDHSVTEAGSMTDFSFDDFLDMINPLQHIPVISSVYREITDDKINPVSRIVGDLLYGGVTGVATAVLGAVGAIGDTVMEANTGKDATGVVVSSLFGPDQKTGDGSPVTQIASATRPALPPSAAAPATPPAMTPAAAALASIASMSPTNTSPTLAPNADAQSQALLAAKSFPLDPKKMPYGGVMDPGLLQGSNMALAMASSAPGVQMNHMVYPGGLTKGVKPSVLPSSSVPAASSAQATNVANVANTNVIPSTGASNPLPPELMQDIASLRALNQYKSTASQSAPAGGNLDVVN